MTTVNKFRTLFRSGELPPIEVAKPIDTGIYVPGFGVKVAARYQPGETFDPYPPKGSWKLFATLFRSGHIKFKKNGS